jgi:hypothetical protein
MLPVVFLDFDGVVNTIYWGCDDNGVYRENTFKGGHTYLNNGQAIGWLNELYNTIPYRVVISSTWRMSMSVEELQLLLLKSGFRPEIEVIGKTPVLNDLRGKEIQQWIDENNYEGDFIIVDDDNDMCHLMEHLVLCDTFVGFTFHEFKKSLNLLQKS